MQNTCNLAQFIQQLQLFSIVKALILVLGGFILARLASRTTNNLIGRYTSFQQTMLLQKTIYFAVLILFIVAALQQLGFQLSVLLGSAGILTAAIAFASQTSISNMISGIFLIMEKSFKVGDRIKIGSTVGVVSSIDLLSVKILTDNNTLVRLPNESLIKSEITNITQFGERRLELSLKVSIDETFEKVKGLLVDLAEKNHYSLKSPSPTVSIQEINSSGMYLKLAVWVEQQKYLALSDTLYDQILTAFRENDIKL